MKLTIDGFRSVIRPALTLSGWGLLLWLAAGADLDVRKQIVSSVLMMVAFWFGERKK